MSAPRRGLLAARPRSASVMRLQRTPGRGGGRRRRPGAPPPTAREGRPGRAMRRAPPPLPLPRSQAGLWPRPSLPWEPPAFPAQPRRPPAPRGRGGGRGGAGPHRAAGASRARRLRPTASISLHGAVGSGPRGCAGVAVLCQPRTPPSPRWIGATGPARRRPRSVSRQRRRGRVGREQVRRRRCRPRTGASEQTDPRRAHEPGCEERWLSGPASG